MVAVTDLHLLLARRYGLALKPAKFLSLLIVHELVTDRLAYDSIGDVSCSNLVFRLRPVLRDKIGGKIHNKRQVGWWLDDDTRDQLATYYGIQIAPVPAACSDDGVIA